MDSDVRKEDKEEEQALLAQKLHIKQDSLDEMIGEYEMVKSEMQRKKSIKFQGQMLMTFISGIEFLNDKFDPFDLNLNGWAEKINEDVDEYDDIFGQLHEKYAGKAEIAPELKLLFMLGGSAFMFHLSKSFVNSNILGKLMSEIGNNDNTSTMNGPSENMDDLINEWSKKTMKIPSLNELEKENSDD